MRLSQVKVIHLGKPCLLTEHEYGFLMVRHLPVEMML